MKYECNNCGRLYKNNPHVCHICGRTKFNEVKNIYDKS